MSKDRFLLSSDYDGTLFFGKLKESDVEAIKKFQEEGNVFVINTGRGLHQIEEIYDGEYPIEVDGYICDSGASIADHNKELIQHNPYPYELIREILEHYPDTAATFSADGWYSALRLSDKFAQYGPVVLYEQVEDLKDHPAASLSFYFDTLEEAREQYEDMKKNGWPLSMQINRLSVDATPEGFSKAKGLNTLADRMEIPKGKRAAIGDSFNDYDALKAADYGFLLETAPQELLDKAKEDGIRIVDSVASAIQILDQES